MNQFEIGIVILKKKLNNPYVDFAFAPHLILPLAPQTPLMANLGDGLFYGGAHPLFLHTGETAHYRDNLRAETPSIWVALRNQYTESPEVFHVTLDPYEGEALATNNLDDVIEKLPMPLAIAEQVQIFIDKYHVEQVFIKRERNKFKTGNNRFEGKLDA